MSIALKNKRARKQIGVIVVNSGLCWIGDPCYVIHRDLPEEVLGKTWEEFCEKTCCHGENHTQFDLFTRRGLDLGLGICVSTGYGDGWYRVFGTFETDSSGHERLVTVEVDFSVVLTGGEER